MSEEHDKKEHILSVLNDILGEIATCPKEGKEKGEIEEWDCNNCDCFRDHFKFLCESVACLCGLFQNMIMSNPEMELEDMREDPLDSIREGIEEQEPEHSIYL
jgi:hypothetical protein